MKCMLFLIMNSMFDNSSQIFYVFVMYFYFLCNILLIEVIQVEGTFTNGLCFVIEAIRVPPWCSAVASWHLHRPSCGGPSVAATIRTAPVRASHVASLRQAFVRAHYNLLPAVESLNVEFVICVRTLYHNISPVVVGELLWRIRLDR